MELETYRQQIFDNLCETMRMCFELLKEFDISLENEEYQVRAEYDHPGDCKGLTMSATGVRDDV